MAWTFEKEVNRKAIHLASILYLVLYLVLFHFIGHKVALFVLSALLIVMIYFEYMRIELKIKIPLIHHLWTLRRRKEKNRMGAEIFWLIGMIICFAVLDVRIAVLAVLMSVFGDMASALIGKRFGKTKMREVQHKPIQKKCWEGVIAELLINLLVGYYFLRAIGDPTLSWFYTTFPHDISLMPVLVVMAIVATTVETAVNKLEDNLLVPLFTGVAGQLTLIILLAL